MAVIKIYGVRSAYSEAVQFYRLKTQAEEEAKKLNKEYPRLEYRVISVYYDEG